jgi:hypothetical protein
LKTLVSLYVIHNGNHVSTYRTHFSNNGTQRHQKDKTSHLVTEFAFWALIPEARARQIY